MRRFNAVVLFIVLALCVSFAPQASAGVRTIPSIDRLPLGDWTYDAMISLAADGLVPGFSARVFEGDRLFNRIEMAQVVASIVESSEEKDLGFNQVALIGHLVSEFKPELRYVNEEALNEWTERSTNISLPTGGEAFLIGYVRGMAADDSGDMDSDDDEEISYRATGFFNISNNVFAMGTAADKEDQFFQQLRDNQTLDKIFLRGTSSNFAWSVGREYLNWGPAYSGSLILSDNSPALTQIRMSKEIDFGKLFGRVKITQFAGAFADNDQRLYLLGRRYEKRLSDRWYAGISETAKTSETPNPLVMILPFYLYQHMFIDVDEKFNVLCAADLTYRTKSGSQIYTELVVDDMTAPRIFWGNKNKRPRKTGYTVGCYVPNILHGDRYSSFRAEYTLIDRLTYIATRADSPEMAYTQDDEIIGHPIGPNAKALYLRGENYFSDKFSVIAEYLNQKQTKAGKPERGSSRVSSLMAAYDITPDKSIALRVSPYKITAPGSAAMDGTKYELRASFAF